MVIPTGGVTHKTQYTEYRVTTADTNHAHGKRRDGVSALGLRAIMRHLNSTYVRIMLLCRFAGQHNPARNDVVRSRSKDFGLHSKTLPKKKNTLANNIVVAPHEPIQKTEIVSFARASV